MPSLRQLPKKSSMEQRLFLNGLNWIRALRLTACDLPLRRVGILPLLAFGSVLGLTSCIPYSILQRQEFQDKEKVAITCEWINKGFHFKRLVFWNQESYSKKLSFVEALSLIHYCDISLMYISNLHTLMCATCITFLKKQKHCSFRCSNPRATKSVTKSSTSA